MSNARSIRNIALIGFMGAGKSSVGRLLAEHLNFGFLDTDDLIETRAGKPISRIFSEDGEHFFREMERAVVAELAARTHVVIATGGGLAASQENFDSLKNHALVVCLWTSADTIYERVRNQTHRPLLRTPDPKEKIRELLRQREPFYRQADVLISTDMRSIKEVTQHVLHQFQLATRPR